MWLFRKPKPLSEPSYPTMADSRRRRVRAKVDEMRKSMGMPAVDWSDKR